MGGWTPDAQAVLAAAAVLAVPAGEDLLAAVAGLPPARMRSGLSQSLGCRLLTENFPYGPGPVCFRHVMAARAIYESIPAPRRRELHQRAGHALEHVSPLPLAQLARHFREAGDSVRGVRDDQRQDLLCRRIHRHRAGHHPRLCL